MKKQKSSEKEKSSHNRDMIWVTEDLRSLKIRDIPSSHLSNIDLFLQAKKEKCIIAWGIKKYNYICKNIRQELRLRKLNRLATEIDTELF